jgi:hypothetical protein
VEAAERELNGSATEELIAARTGLAPVKIRQVRAEAAVKPVSIDETPDIDSPSGIRDKSADTESQAVVNTALGEAAAAIGALGWPGPDLLALVYYFGLKVADAARVIGVDPEVAREI